MHLYRPKRGRVLSSSRREPFTAKGIFEVERQRALTLFLAVDGSTAITSGIRFTPQIILARPGKVLINLKGFVTTSASNLISVFDKKTMLVVDAIATGRGPEGISLDQKRARVTMRGMKVFTFLSGVGLIPPIRWLLRCYSLHWRRYLSNRMVNTSQLFTNFIKNAMTEPTVPVRSLSRYN